MKVGRTDVAGSLNAVFIYGKGRPVALAILLLLTLLNVLSELPNKVNPGNAGDTRLAATVGLPFAESRRLLFDGLQKKSPRIFRSQPVTVVAIDEASLAKIGQWPWPRNVLARLIRQINESGPAAIGLDLYMPERDQTSPDRVATNLPPEANRLASDLAKLPSHDHILADALKSTPSVLGAVGVVADANASIYGMRMTPVKVNGENALPFVREYSQVLSSLPELQEAVHGQAVLCVELDQGVVRRVPLVVGLNGQLAPGLAMEMLRVATDSPAIEVDVKRHGLETVGVADLTVPVQPQGDIWLHYASIKSTGARYVSAVDVLEGKVSPDHLEGKLVLVGLTGNGLNDWRTTALGELVPGVEIQAQVLETLFDGHFILRPWWMKWVETACLLLFGGLMILWVPQTNSSVTSFLNSLSRISLLLVMVFNAMVAGIAYLLFQRFGLMFDAGAFLIMTLGVMGCLIVSTMLASAQRARLLAEKEAQTERARAKLASQLENMVDALVKLIAGAIDAKSPYTGGHCERVPDLAVMLAEAASEVKEGPLAAFSFENENEWREFRIGTWLHDCGKVTTPEYVVDKATKLETIYNRIHEIRTRFEVLLRDAKISQFEAVAQGQDAETAEAAYRARLQQLQDDFAFIAECNIGGEFMAPEKIERLKKIAEETWLRHFDDRLGLSDAELQHFAHDETTLPLPVKESLIADKPQHVIPRTDRRIADPKWGFKLDIPQNLYNQGEAYNLSISRGTLTQEERYKINEHVMQSLMMLEQLPLPDHLKRVPEYAGTHHETLIGTGYPRKLGANELSIPARVIAIADIFEALTASDRPYKRAKTLSEAIKILSFFKKDGHIDPDLFRLFLSSGVYLKFAEKHLAPEQMDTVDIDAYLF